MLDFDTDGNEREFGRDQDVSLKTLARLRTELIKGDLRCAYLGWLLVLPATKKRGNLAVRPRFSSPGVMRSSARPAPSPL